MSNELVELIGCFDAAIHEGLYEALAETTDQRLKDLVERRLLVGYQNACGPHLLAFAPKAVPVPAGEYPPLPAPFIGVQDRPYGGRAEVIRSAIGEDGVVSCYTEDQMCAYVDADRAARAPADSQPAPVLDRDRIREIFMAHGFTVKEGQTDLKQYVYDAADALLRAARATADRALQLRKDDGPV